MLSALLLRQLQPTRYREVVLTSLPRSDSPGNRPFFLSNTVTEHYPKMGPDDSDHSHLYHAQHNSLDRRLDNAR
jgi:hypothetical protein